MQFQGVKEQGAYTTGVGVDFIQFQRTLHDLPVSSITCLSKDKVVLDLHVKVQIRYERSALIPLILRQYGTRKNHEVFLEHIATAILVDKCLEYDAEQYYTMRSEVDAMMFQELVLGMNNHDFGAEVEFFQLINIQLPSELAYIIEKKQNIAQEIITATNDRENQLIKADTAYLQAEQQAQVILINANNTAAITTNRADTRQAIVQTEWENRAAAYDAVITALGLDAESFIAYLKSEIARSADRVVTN
jgi:hypothetical protein